MLFLQGVLVPIVDKQKIILDNHYENIYGPVRAVYASLREHFIQSFIQFALYQLVRHALLFRKDVGMCYLVPN